MKFLDKVSRDRLIEMMKTELRTKRNEKFIHVAVCRETTNNVAERRNSECENSKQAACLACLRTR